jgi:eukaryotic-like serine/threonine-protein kinase
VEEAIELGCDVVTGLCDLHRANIVHRDLKPSNIILEPRADGGRRAIIVDFGVSRLMKGSDADDELTNITRADMALGTLEYMAPEQMLDSRNVTGASDIYAVGAMFFRAVAGKHAFGNLADIELARNKLLNETPPLVTGRNDPVAKGYEEIIGKALRRKPADRYKRAVDFLTDLRMLRERARQQAKEALRAMPSIVDDATMDTVTQVIPMDIFRWRGSLN